MAYLAKMDARFLQYAGQITSTAAGAKLAFHWWHQHHRTNGTVNISLADTGNTPTPKYDSGGGYSVTGSLQFIIEYTQ